MEGNKFFEKLREKVKAIIGEKGSHDFNHTERVYNYALLISKELDVDLDIVKTSALLHDIARDKEDKGEIKDHAEQGAIEARKILEELNFPKEKIEIVCKCILLHNKKEDIPEIKEVRVLKEADGLETISAIGIARDFSFNGEKSNWSNIDESPLNRLIKHSNNDYFKLPVAKELAKTKTRFTNDFCNQFIKEYNLKWPKKD